jgi:type II secretion system protein H
LWCPRFRADAPPRLNKNAAGFSLLELLVVIVIIGLGVAIIGVAVGNNKPQELRNNARDFANFTALVEEEAVLSRESWGVQIYREQSEDGGDKIAYRFLRLTDRGWLFDHPRDIPDGGKFADNVVAELEIEGAQQLIEPLPKALTAADNTNADDAEADSAKTKTERANAKTESAKTKSGDSKKSSAGIPTIWLAPGGEVTPFELRLHFSGDDDGPVVRSDALGRIQLDVKENDEDQK